MNTSQKPDIQRLLEFQKLLLAFSQVDRMTHRKHDDIFINENDTEHSYNLALTAWYLADYFPHLDRDTLIRYALIHDLVEVHAGDTYIYGTPEDLNSKQERERAAHKKITADWKDFPDLSTHITSYELRKDEESNFVYALDKIMPIMLIYLHDGYTWKLEHIALERLDSVKRAKVQLSPEIYGYYMQLYELLSQNQHLFGKA